VSGADAVLLDCRGQRCPLPIIELAKRIAGVPVGAVLMLLADDPAARSDVPAWCRMQRQDYLGESRGADDSPAYSVRRTH
jgi:tRNA 2-thiouridine synthesizing protein A